jgi:FKBP-type peptidyl-prolyl cis-trans isomerase
MRAMKGTRIVHLILIAGLASAACKAKPKEEKPAPTVTATTTAVSSGKPGDLPAPADVAAPPANAEKTSSGLASVVLTPGSGDGTKPTQNDKVKVHYTGWTTDGKMFDSSQVRGTPATFGVTQVIKGWTEGLQLMTVGEKRRFWIPAGLAYGETPKRPGAPSGQLTFDVELLEIIAGPKPPPVPEDVSAVPATAKKTKSGLAYRVLTKGTGTKHPTETSRVRVHYTGWTTDGKMFDSSVTRGQPMSFSLQGVVKGWTEGVQLMVEGEKTRFWIPGDLAYGDTPKQPGAPAGTLVFDIELLKVLDTPPGASSAASGRTPAASKPPGAAGSAKPTLPKPTAPKASQ